jgi:hypothetical protein
MSQKPTLKIRRLKPLEQQLSKVKVTEVGVEVDGVVWSIECTVDELQRDLCRTTEEITIERNFYINGQMSVKKLTVRKYYRQARELMKWIPIAKPSPEFVINASDLSPKVIEELEVRIDNPSTLSYILKQAAGRVFENLDFDYYHLSVARNLRVRIEP